MFDFKDIRNKFGDNPFLSTLNSILPIVTTKPYKKGELINYQGRNFVCQRDVGVGKNVFLVLDGGIAIPEEVETDTPLNERLVLDRRVSDPAAPPEPVLPWLWGVNYLNEAITYPNGTVRGKIKNLDLLDAFYFSIYADKRDAVHTISLGSPN